MSRRIAVFLAVTLIASVSPVWAQVVTTHFDPSVSFKTIKTYYWAKTDPIQNDEINKRVVDAVDRWLTYKGWTKAPVAEGDVVVVPLVTTQKGQTLNTFYDAIGEGWDYRGAGTTTTVEHYTKGTLVLDLFARQTKKLIWRGEATGTIPDDPKKAGDKINKATEKMFKTNFPPGVAKD